MADDEDCLHWASVLESGVRTKTACKEEEGNAPGRYEALDDAFAVLVYGQSEPDLGHIEPGSVYLEEVHDDRLYEINDDGKTLVIDYGPNSPQDCHPEEMDDGYLSEDTLDSGDDAPEMPQAPLRLTRS